MPPDNVFAKAKNHDDINSECRQKTITGTAETGRAYENGSRNSVGGSTGGVDRKCALQHEHQALLYAGPGVVGSLFRFGSRRFMDLPVDRLDQPEVPLDLQVVDPPNLLDEPFGERLRINPYVVHEEMTMNPVLDVGPHPNEVRPVPHQLPELHRILLGDIRFGYAPSPQEVREGQGVDPISLRLRWRYGFRLQGVGQDDVVPLTEYLVDLVPGRRGFGHYLGTLGKALGEPSHVLPTVLSPVFSVHGAILLHHNCLGVHLVEVERSVHGNGVV